MSQLDLLDAPTVSRPELSDQCWKAIDLMIQNNGLTRREAMDEGIGNLPARIGEIRKAFGADSVETRDVKDSKYSRYFYHGPRP